MGKNNRKKTTETVLAGQLIAGTKKHLANWASLQFAGATHTPGEIETAFQTLVDLRTGVNAAKATVKAKLATEEAQAPAIVILMDAFVTWVKATFDGQPDVLEDFGVTPRKARTPLTVEQLAAAKAKRDATRAARGTAGKQQKKAKKGNVVGVVVTPVTAVVQPAAPAQGNAPAQAVNAPAGTAGHGTNG